MLKTTPEIKTPADLLAYLQEFGTAQITALNGILDKVPENLKAEYTSMRDRLNALLKGLAPTEQVPAAQEAAWALNSFARTLTDIFEYADAFRARIDALVADIATKQTALNGFDSQLAAGDLVSKDKVELAVAAGVDAAVVPLRAEITSLRTGQVALCGLPECPASVLAGEAPAFAASLTQAQANLAALTQKGLALNGKGDGFVRKSVWLDQTAFNGEAKLLDDLAPGLKLDLSAGDPMKGTKPAEPAPAAPAKTHVLA